MTTSNRLENPLIKFLNSERKSTSPSDEMDRKILEHIGMSIAGLEPFNPETIETIEKRIQPWLEVISRSKVQHGFNSIIEHTSLHIHVDPPRLKGTIRSVDRAWGFVASYLLMDPEGRPKIGMCHSDRCLRWFPIMKNTLMQRFCSNRCRMRAKRYPHSVIESALPPDPRGDKKGA
jgi:hypothetical protein